MYLIFQGLDETIAMSDHLMKNCELLFYVPDPPEQGIKYRDFKYITMKRLRQIQRFSAGHKLTNCKTLIINYIT